MQWFSFAWDVYFIFHSNLRGFCFTFNKIIEIIKIVLLICGTGIICGLGSFAGWDHLWACTDRLRYILGIISGLGIICGPIWGSFAGRDHLRARISKWNSFAKIS